MVGSVGQEVTQRTGSEVGGQSEKSAGLELGSGLGPRGRDQGTGPGFAKAATV